MTRVVVTGMGAICSHGMNVPAIWNEVLFGESRFTLIDPRTHFDPAKYSRAIRPDTVVAAVQKTHEELALLAGVEKAQRFDRHQLFALYAADEAMVQAGALGAAEPERFGCIVATGDGGLAADQYATERLMENGRLDPFTNIRELPNIFGGLLANRFGLQGPSYVHCTACAASSHAIMHAADQIMLGRADMMLVGGAEAAIVPFGIGSFAAQRALGTDSRPYQSGRDGFVMGEGAAMLVLESYEHALARDATIYGELIGYASTYDGESGGQITDPNPRGGERSARLALEMAGIDASHLGAVSAHGTGTPVGDVAEIMGIKAWAHPHARNLPVTALKSHFGHLLGAAGALSSIISLTMLREGIIVPTRGLTNDTLDSVCEGVSHVMGPQRLLEKDAILVNAFGFGGTNASLVFRRMLH